MKISTEVFTDKTELDSGSLGIHLIAKNGNICPKVSMAIDAGFIDPSSCGETYVYFSEIGNYKTLAVTIGEENFENVNLDVDKISNAILKYMKPSNTKAYISIKKNSPDVENLIQTLSIALIKNSYKFSMDPIECDLDITFILEDSECDDYSSIVKEAVAIGESLNYAKRLGDLPSNVCTPEYLSIRAQEDFTDLPVDVKVFGEVEAKQLKMEGFMSVSVGSDKEGQVITFDYRGGNKGDTEIVLVGKAVTFDSGGISIKPSSSMEEMKYDMCGGSTVFGVIKAAATMGLPINIRGIVGAVENMPSGSATKPGDVIVMMSGKTVEVQNTDAEGRMVLADLLTYVGENYNADTVIDFATLTGACVSALGSHAAGVFTESDFLAEELYRSGIKTNDKCWRLPIWEEYNKQMDCDFADMGNAGKKGAGASTAACFLNRFASDYEYDYAHVDIAGVAWEKTATGRPIMMMLDYLKMRSQE